MIKTDFEFKDNGVNFEKVAFESLHQLVELDFACAEDSKQILVVCVDEFSTCVLTRAHSDTTRRGKHVDRLVGLRMARVGSRMGNAGR